MTSSLIEGNLHTLAKDFYNWLLSKIIHYVLKI